MENYGMCLWQVNKRRKIRRRDPRNNKGRGDEIDTAMNSSRNPWKGKGERSSRDGERKGENLVKGKGRNQASFWLVHLWVNKADVKSSHVIWKAWKIVKGKGKRCFSLFLTHSFLLSQITTTLNGTDTQPYFSCTNLLPYNNPFFPLQPSRLSGIKLVREWIDHIVTS